MRATLIFLSLLSMTAAPMVAGWSKTCAHEQPAMTAGAEHTMHASMDMGAETGPEAPCHCDPGCAEHCDAAVPAALLGIERPARPMAKAMSRIAVVASFHDDPPRGAPLRPPQTRSA